MSHAAGTREYLVVSGAYLGFTLGDGALRMLVLLHFAKAGMSPVAIALLFDPVAASWEIVYRMAIDAMEPPETTWEYDEFRLAGRAEAHAIGALSACARQILPFAFGEDEVVSPGEQTHPA